MKKQFDAFSSDRLKSEAVAGLSAENILHEADPELFSFSSTNNSTIRLTGPIAAFSGNVDLASLPPEDSGITIHREEQSVSVEAKSITGMIRGMKGLVK